jgi:hypothetical protein
MRHKNVYTRLVSPACPEPSVSIHTANESISVLLSFERVVAALGDFHEKRAVKDRKSVV